jgi:hypothetical protein
VFYSSQRSPVFPLYVRAVLLDQGAEISHTYFWRSVPSAANGGTTAGR